MARSCRSVAAQPRVDDKTSQEMILSRAAGRQTSAGPLPNWDLLGYNVDTCIPSWTRMARYLVHRQLKLGRPYALVVIVSLEFLINLLQVLDAFFKSLDFHFE